MTLNRILCAVGIWLLVPFAVTAGGLCFVVYGLEKTFYGLGRFVLLPLTEGVRDAAHWLNTRLK